MAEVIRVLYVDDEKGLLDIGKMFLEESNEFSVTIIDSASNALELLINENFDAIISDYQMPGMDGIEFLIEVRKSFGKIPFILFTGKGREEVVIQAINSGVDFYLQKGGEPEAQFAELSHKTKQAVFRKRAEDELRITQEKYTKAFLSSPDGVMITDLETGKFIEINDATSLIYGYSRDEMVGKSAIDLGIWLREEDRDVFINKVKNEGQVERFEMNERRKSGDTFYASISVDTIILDGKTHLISTVRDITETKQAEEALKEKTEEINQYFTTNLDLFCIADTNGFFRRLNPEWEKALGYTLPELEGHKFLDFIHPDDLPATFSAISELEKKIEVINFINRYRHKNGEYRWIEWRSFPNSKNSLIYASARDITERIQMELELVSANEHIKEIHHLAHIGTWDWVIETDTIKWSEELCKIAGWDSTKPAPNYAELPHHYTPKNWDNLNCAVNNALTSGESFNLELEMIRPDDNAIWTNVFGGVIRDINGNVIGLHGTVQDINERKKAEEMLFEAQMRTATILEGIADTFYSLDDKWRFTTINAAAEKAPFGKPASEMLGKVIWDLYPGLMGTSIYGHYLNAMKNCTLEHYEAQSPLNKGWYEVFMKGRKSGIDVYMRDITDRKKVEATLHESEEKFRSLVEHALEGIIILDLQGNILFVNNAAAKTIEIENISGLTGRNVMEFIAPESREDVMRDFTQVLQGHDAYIAHYNVISAKGNKFCVESIGKVITYEGKPADLISIRDITERKKAEEALRESEEFNRNLVENIPDYLLIYDQKGIILYSNPLFLQKFGFTQKEAVGSPIIEHITHEYHDKIRTLMEKRLSHMPVSPYEVSILKKDGTAVPVIVKGSHILFQDKDAVLVLMNDITEHKKSEEALRQANKKLNLLSSITRHDINNQLTVLMSYLTILEMNQSGPPYNEYFQKANKAAERISAMILLTREYESIGVTEPVWQDCHSLVDIAAKESQTGKILIENFISTGIKVFADPLIIKVFFNLIDNALRYGGKITTIRFFLQEFGNDHLIICKDDGEGIPTDEKEKIFERGFGKNTGFGLFLIREILAITGMTIVETGEFGMGARFEIFVPNGKWRYEVDEN